MGANIQMQQNNESLSQKDSSQTFTFRYPHSLMQNHQYRIDIAQLWKDIVTQGGGAIMAPPPLFFQLWGY